MYIRRLWRYSGIVEIERFHTRRYYGGKRGDRVKQTPEEIKRINERNRKKKLFRKIANNFKSNEDLYLTFTYRKENRKDEAGVKADIRKLLAELRKYYKKMNTPLKYIWTLEIGKRGGIHFHMILKYTEGILNKLSKLWTNGGVKSEVLWSDCNFMGLAGYIEKQERKKGEQSYHPSRNLVMPEPDVRVMRAKEWRKNPQPPKGYWLWKPSIYEGRDALGYRVQYCFYVKYSKENAEMGRYNKHSEDTGDWIIPKNFWEEEEKKNAGKK